MPIFNLQMCVDTNQEANVSTLFELRFVTYTVIYRSPKYSTRTRTDVQQKVLILHSFLVFFTENLAVSMNT